MADDNSATGVPVLAIDGPGGAGKGTICQAVATALDWHLLDSGALYRLVGLDATRRGVDFDDAEALGELARRLDVRFVPGAEGVRIQLNGDDVTADIRTETAGLAASRPLLVRALRRSMRPTPLRRTQGSLRNRHALVAEHSRYCCDF